MLDKNIKMKDRKLAPLYLQVDSKTLETLVMASDRGIAARCNLQQDAELIKIAVNNHDALEAKLKVTVEVLKSTKRAIKHFNHSEKCLRQQSCHFEENPAEQCICIHDIGIHEIDQALADIKKIGEE